MREPRRTLCLNSGLLHLSDNLSANVLIKAWNWGARTLSTEQTSQVNVARLITHAERYLLLLSSSAFLNMDATEQETYEGVSVSTAQISNNTPLCVSQTPHTPVAILLLLLK